MRLRGYYVVQTALKILLIPIAQLLPCHRIAQTQVSTCHVTQIHRFHRTHLVFIVRISYLSRAPLVHRTNLVSTTHMGPLLLHGM